MSSNYFIFRLAARQSFALLESDGDRGLLGRDILADSEGGLVAQVELLQVEGEAAMVGDGDQGLHLGHDGLDCADGEDEVGVLLLDDGGDRGHRLGEVGGHGLLEGGGGPGLVRGGVELVEAALQRLLPPRHSQARGRAAGPWKVRRY